MRADFSRSLRTLLASEDDLRSRFLKASVEQRLFGVCVPVEIAGALFSVVRRLGAGAMGAVYEVERAEYSGNLALKLLHAGGSEQEYRLKHEFRTLSQLGHPNLVILHELFADADGCAFTMELIHGSEFFAYVRPDDRLDLARLRHVLAQLADGLQFLHEHGVIHRDLKPSNLLIEPNGRAVMLDFGVALVGPERDISGTARFMAPEQRDGCTVPASDLYALGRMLEIALSGPSEANTHTSRVILAPSAASSELAALHELAGALQSHDPAQRPTPRELSLAVRHVPRSSWSLPASPQFIGRAEELSRLSRFATEHAASNALPRLAWVEGPSGLGKSTLLAEFMRRTAGSCRWTLYGRCCRRESVRYRALDPVLDALSDALLSADSALVEQLSGCVTEPLLELFPALARVPTFAKHVARDASLADPRERRAAAVAALRTLLSRLAQARELCLCIDDAHWLDAESLEMMRELLLAEDAPALLWICASRPHEGGELERLVQALPAHTLCHLELRELTPGDADTLARALWPHRADLWPWATEGSAGNPFVLGQLGQLALESGLSSAELGFERVLERRVAALPEHARDLLALVCVSSLPLSLDMLSRCSSASRAQIEAARHLLETQRYLRFTASQDGLEPYHDRIAEAAQALIAPDARIRAHRSIAEALEASTGALHARALFFHFQRAQEPKSALRFGKLAAQRATERLSFHEAAEIFETCGELTVDAEERAELARARAEALTSAGRNREAASVFQQLAHGAARHEQRFELTCAAADLLFRAGYQADAMRTLEPWLRGLALSPCRTTFGHVASFLQHRARLALPARLGVRTPMRDANASKRIQLCLLMTDGLSRSEILQSLDYASRLAVAVRHGATTSQHVRALLIEALLQTNLAPRSDRAERLLQRAQRECDSVDEPLLQARVSAVSAAVAGLRIDRPRMAQHARRAVQLYEAHGRGVQTELNEVRCMWLICEFGRGLVVDRELSAIVRDAALRGDRFGEASARIYLAAPLLAAGRPEAARTESTAALELVGATPREGMYWSALGQYARVELFEGRVDAAQERLGSALRSMRTRGFLLVPWMRIELRYLWALSVAQSQRAGAHTQVREAARTLARENLRWPRLLADQLQAWLIGSAGQTGRAARQLELNARELERHGGAWYGAGSLLLAHQFRDQREEANELLSRLRRAGLSNPRRFLAAYAPLLKEAKHESDN